MFLTLSLLLAAYPWTAWSDIPSQKSLISTEQREDLRFRLENRFNEVDLLVKNQAADQGDLKKQDREARALKVYERIPFDENLPQIENELRTSASQNGLKLQSIRFKARKNSPPPVARSIYTSEGYRLRPDQIAQKIPFTVVVSGKHEAVEAWVRSWQVDVLRLMEPNREGENLSIRPGSRPREWAVDAHAYRYWKIRYPELRVKDPVLLLPKEIRRNAGSLTKFAQAEPLLWSFVSRTRSMLPRTKPLFDARREILLNHARLDFFFSKATPKKK